MLIAWPCFGIGSLSKLPLCPEKEKTLMAQEEDSNIMKYYLHKLTKKTFYFIFRADFSVIITSR